MAAGSDNVFPKVILAEGAAPATPSANQVKAYAKADGLLYSKDDAGVETLMSSGAASGIPATILDVKGDLIAASAADTAARLAAAANGAALITASGESTGLKWRLNNDGAAVAPAVTDDSGDGYSIGSRWLDTTADKEYVALDVSVGAAVWVETTATGGGGGGASDAMIQQAVSWGGFLEYVAGRYYDNVPFGRAASSGGALVLGTLYFLPRYVSRTHTFDRIGINVSSGAAAGREARLGIYSSDANGLPAALVLDAGLVSCATTGVKEITISQSLTGDTMYWDAIEVNNALLVFQHYSIVSRQQGRSALTVTADLGPARTVAHTYGALPNPAGTVAADENVLRNIMIALRA